MIITSMNAILDNRKRKMAEKQEERQHKNARISVVTAPSIHNETMDETIKQPSIDNIMR
jgi:hypothetical protein